MDPSSEITKAFDALASFDEAKIMSISNASISELKQLVKLKIEITHALDKIPQREVPSWIIDGLAAYSHGFANFLANKQNHNQRDITGFISQVYFGTSQHDYIRKQAVTLPTIQSWLSYSGAHEEIFKQFEPTIRPGIDQAIELRVSGLAEDQKEIRGLIDQSRPVLAALQDNAAKVTVRNYATVFSNQAESHSNFSVKEQKIGASEIWLFVACLISISLFTILFTNGLALPTIDCPRGTIWCPDLIVAIGSRILILSLIIFLISFSFRQYRINKHLATLNKHRANTLKSYAFLAAALDPTDGDTRNAILMKVAQSIYDAGHTGYVSGNDSGGDVPTIVDMSKIISAGKG